MRLVSILVAIVITDLAESSSAFGYELLVATLEHIQQELKLTHDEATQDLRRAMQSINGSPSCPLTCANEEGVYRLRPEHSTIDPFSVYCDNSVEAGGWIVIHRRVDGSLNFFRNWTSYKDGFGDLQGEHWLSLEKIHQLTRSGPHELLVVMKSFNGTEKTARFSTFTVASEFRKYRLDLGKFVEGAAKNSLSISNRMMFSTPDQDNDASNGTKGCANVYRSGWWFNACYDANLNGLYQRGKVGATMLWDKFNNSKECLKEARMMIRRNVKASIRQ